MKIRKILIEMLKFSFEIFLLWMIVIEESLDYTKTSKIITEFLDELKADNKNFAL